MLEAVATYQHLLRLTSVGVVYGLGGLGKGKDGSKDAPCTRLVPPIYRGVDITGSILSYVCARMQSAIMVTASGKYGGHPEDSLQYDTLNTGAFRRQGVCHVNGYSPKAHMYLA